MYGTHRSTVPTGVPYHRSTVPISFSLKSFYGFYDLYSLFIFIPFSNLIVERGVVTLFSRKHLLFNFGRLGFLYGKSHRTHFTNTFLQNGIAGSVRFAPMTAVFAMSTVPTGVRNPQESVGIYYISSQLMDTSGIQRKCSLIGLSYGMKW